MIGSTHGSSTTAWEAVYDENAAEQLRLAALKFMDLSNRLEIDFEFHTLNAEAAAESRFCRFTTEHSRQSAD